jgi:hypothetical protein
VGSGCLTAPSRQQRERYEYEGDFDEWPDAGETCGIAGDTVDGMRVAFAAVLPSLVAEIREQIARGDR